MPGIPTTTIALAVPGFLQLTRNFPKSPGISRNTRFPQFPATSL